jgi:hypothetical protein
MQSLNYQGQYLGTIYLRSTDLKLRSLIYGHTTLKAPDLV